MELVSSSLYESADLMRDQLLEHLKTTLKQDLSIMIGPPSKVMATNGESLDAPVLNLFFYKIQPPGFFPGTGPNETWRVRLHCLVTAFGATDHEGEDELKMIGQVLSYFHEHPTLKGKGEESEDFYWLEVVFQPLTSEEINQIWSTFGGVSYRTSLIYEVSLIPVEPKVKAVPAPPVVSGGATRNVSASGEPTYAKPPEAPITAVPGRLIIDISQPGWAPAIAFIETVAGETKALPSLTKTLSDIDPDGTDPSVELWIAGEAGAEVDVIVQYGRPGVWTDLPVALKTSAPIPSNSQNQLDLDPSADLSGWLTVSANVDSGDLEIEADPEAATQFLIYARRNLDDGSSVRSNPLILNITGSQHIAEGGP